MQSAKDCNPKISSVSLYGVVTVYFPYGLKTISSDFFDNVTSSLDIRFIPSNSTIPKKAASNITGWYVTQYKSQSISIQLTF